MRILIGLMEHMGDIVACEPVARYLRFNHPDAHLTWVVNPIYRELVETNLYVDETIVLDCLTDWIKLKSHSQYDRIVDLHVNYRICQHCQIPLVKKDGNPFVSVYEWFDYGALLEAFSVGAGLPKLSVQPRLYLQSDHAEVIDALELPAAFCVIHRYSNSDEKDWTKAGWEALSSIVQNELGIPIVEVGAGKWAQTIPPLEGSISLVNRLSILETAEVIRRAKFFIGIDSGPAHLANAQHIPGIVLLGRHGFFRQYSPYTGYYATNAPTVRIIRNLLGNVCDINIASVAEAVRYVNAALDDAPPLLLPGAALPRPNQWPPHKQPESARLLESGLFDIGWYVLNYPEVADCGLHPVDHYILEGADLGYDPGPGFDTGWYKKIVPGLAPDKTNPLMHYIAFGWAEGIRLPPADTGPDGAPRAKPGPISKMSGVLETGRKNSGGTIDGLPKIFAFYLPQFHPIPENDWAHGAGFTEWNNVIKAKPLFRGHYQPRIPGELGFYDLRAEQTLRDQIRLAQEHGIDGFCFYYYYFQGRKLLYTPLDNFIHSDIDAPFLLLWANENWSKRWDGGDKEIIISQHHSTEDDIAFLRELAPTFHDRRYVKVEGKPILMVYKTHLFPDIEATVALWREEILKYGFPGIYLIMADDWNGELSHPRDFGFDASYEIPSNILPSQVMSSETASLELVHDFSGHIVDYRKFAQYHLGRPFPVYKRFRTVMLPWDNTARYGSRAIVHVDGLGGSYKLWLLQAILDTYRRYEPDERIVFVHSWNEWCEGTYLEPDGKYGRFFLEQTKEATLIAKDAIQRTETLPTGQVAAELIDLQNEKDKGAYLVMAATRLQTHYAHGNFARERRENTILQDALSYTRYRVAQTEGEANNAYFKANQLEREVLETHNLLIQVEQESLETRNQLTQIEQEYLKTSNQLTQAEQEAVKKSNQLAQLEQESLKTSNQLAQLEQEILETRSQLTFKVDEVEMLRNSTSWRLMQPLRKFVQILRGS